MHDNHFPSTGCTLIHRHVINRTEKENLFRSARLLIQHMRLYTTRMEHGR